MMEIDGKLVELSALRAYTYSINQKKRIGFYQLSTSSESD